MVLTVIRLICTICSLLQVFCAVGVSAEKPGVRITETKEYVQLLRDAENRNNLEIVCDPYMQEVFDLFEQNSGWDVLAVTNTIPDIFSHMRWVYALCPDIFNNMRDYFLQRAYDYEFGTNDTTIDAGKMVMFKVFGILAGMPETVEIGTEPQDRSPNLRRITLTAIYQDGSRATIDSGIDFNTATNTIEQTDVNLGNVGIASTGFNFDVDDAFAYSSTYPQLQRILRYAKLYDDLFLDTAAIRADTVRLQYTYQNRDWMLQLWKGRYFFTTGGEVGFYNKPEGDTGDWWDCAQQPPNDQGNLDERLPMTFRLTVKETGEVLVDRPQTKHWWMTAFVLKPYLYTAERITLESTITLPDTEVKDAIAASLEEQIAAGVQITYTDNGDNSLTLVW